MRKDLENLTLMGHIEGKRIRGELSHLPNKLVKWMAEQRLGRDSKKTSIAKC